MSQSFLLKFSILVYSYQKLGEPPYSAGFGSIGRFSGFLPWVTHALFVLGIPTTSKVYMRDAHQYTHQEIRSSLSLLSTLCSVNDR